MTNAIYRDYDQPALDSQYNNRGRGAGLRGVPFGLCIGQ